MVWTVLLPVYASDDATKPSELRKQIRNQIKNETGNLRKNIIDEVNDNLKGLRENIIKNVNKTALNQFARITNGQVTAVNVPTLTVSKDGKIYTVSTDSNTQFRRHFWGKSGLSEITVGDMVNVQGKFTDDAKTSILARLIRDLSIQKRFGVFFGNVISVNGNNIIIETVNRGNQTVTVSGTTKFINRKQQNMNQSDVYVGHRIRVRGLWDKSASTIAGVTEVKDFSIPPVATPTPTLTPTSTL